MAVSDLDVEGIAVAEFKTNAPTGVHGHRPLVSPFAFELVMAFAGLGLVALLLTPETKDRDID